MGFSRNSQFSVQLDRRNGVARLALQGELDMATAPSLDDSLGVVQQDGVKAVLLDLRELTFIDSTGLRALLRAHNRAEENGHRLGIVGASEEAKKLFQITQTEQLLDGPASVRLIATFTRASGASDEGNPAEEVRDDV